MRIRIPKDMDFRWASRQIHSILEQEDLCAIFVEDGVGDDKTIVNSAGYEVLLTFAQYKRLLTLVPGLEFIMTDEERVRFMVRRVIADLRIVDIAWLSIYLQSDNDPALEPWFEKAKELFFIAPNGALVAPDLVKEEFFAMNPLLRK